MYDCKTKPTQQQPVLSLTMTLLKYGNIFKSHCNSGVRSHSLPKELSKFGIHCLLVLTLIRCMYLDRVLCVLIFPRF